MLKDAFWRQSTHVKVDSANTMTLTFHSKGAQLQVKIWKQEGYVPLLYIAAILLNQHKTLTNKTKVYWLILHDVESCVSDSFNFETPSEFTLFIK